LIVIGNKILNTVFKTSYINDDLELMTHHHVYSTTDLSS